MSMQITGATGPYTEKNGPGWYGRNAAAAAKEPLKQAGIDLLTKGLSSAPEDQAQIMKDTLGKITVQYAPEEAGEEAITENALGYGAEEITQQGDTREAITDYLKSFTQDLTAALQNILPEPVFATVEKIIPETLTETVDKEFTRTDRNGNGKIDLDEAAAAQLFKDDPVHAIEAVDFEGEEERAEDSFSKEALINQLNEEDSRLDGVVTPTERLTAGMLESNAPETTGKALDKLIADFSMTEKANAFASAQTNVEESDA